MYNYSRLSQLQNNKCYECKFCVWDSERQEMGCEIHWCINNSNYIKFDTKEMVKKK